MSGNGNYMLESNIEWQQEQLLKHINKLNEQTKARDLAVGMLTNDLNHWAGYGVYNIGQFQLYLEREYEHNLAKDARRNQ